MKYNLYKINSGKTELLIENLIEKNFKASPQKNVSDYQLVLYLKNREIPDNVSWTSTILPFFDYKIIKKEKNPSAIIIISKDDNKYCLTFGYGHFYVKNYIDSSFPFDYISRINMESYTNVGLNNHLKNKTKSIHAYRDSRGLPSETGSSVIKITGRPGENENIGTHIEVGDSIQIFKDMSLDYLVQYIDVIEEIIEDREPKSIPRINRIKDEKLMHSLFEEVVDKFNSGELRSGLDQFEVIGTYYVFNNVYSEYKLTYRRKQLGCIPSLGIDDIKDKLDENGIFIETVDDLKSVNIKFIGLEHTTTKSLSEVINYLNDNNYHLIEGKWYDFNDEYINQLNKKIQGIPLIIRNDFNTNEKMYKSDRKTDIPQVNDSTETRNEYFEEYLNRKIVESDNRYINRDKDIKDVQGYKIEPCDIYDARKKEIIAIKAGKPQKIAYVIDQIITAIVSIKTGVLDYDVEFDRAAIWMVLERKTQIKSLSDIKSLILKIKIIEWVQLCQDYNINPSIYLSHRVK